MGWWDSLWPSSSGADDPLGKLDPKLREFLEKESPVKYNAAAAAHPQPTTTKTQTQPIAAPLQAKFPAAETSREDDENKPTVPKESQFQDGRYAHLWKTYRPLAEVEAETKSDHERLMDVLEAYKERKNQIGRAALENCALEQVDWRSCMTNPSLADRMTLCRAQVRKFERCYMMQTRFLKALGYLSSYDRSPEVEEEIQLHADKLYHRMLEQEAEVEKAKAEGRPIPKFTSLIPPPRPVTAAATTADLELTPEQQEALRARLEKVPEEDRAAEAEAIKGEWRAKAEVASRVQGLWRQQEEDRRARKERGEQTMWDKVAAAFGGGGGGGGGGSDGEGKK